MLWFYYLVEIIMYCIMIFVHLVLFTASIKIFLVCVRLKALDDWSQNGLASEFCLSKSSKCEGFKCEVQVYLVWQLARSFGNPFLFLAKYLPFKQTDKKWEQLTKDTAFYGRCVPLSVSVQSVCKFIQKQISFKQASD